MIQYDVVIMKCDTLLGEPCNKLFGFLTHISYIFPCDLTCVLKLKYDVKTKQIFIIYSLIIGNCVFVDLC